MKFYPCTSANQGCQYHQLRGSLIRHLVLDTSDTAALISHYRVSDCPDADGEISIHELMRPEYLRYSGFSSWQRDRALRHSVIGIHTTIADQHSVAQTSYYQDHQGKRWFHFPKKQIAALIEFAGLLVKRYKIKPTRVVGHADIAPGRKQDPGPLFPWYTLAHEEIGAWPRAAVVEYYEKKLKERSLTLAQQQAALKQYGYEIPTHGVLDPKTKNTITSFQMHFSPTDYLGNMDDSSQAVLCALVEDYCPKAKDTTLGTQLPSSGVEGPAVNSQRFLESIASYPVGEAAQPGAATASKDQLFKPTGLCQLFNLT